MENKPIFIIKVPSIEYLVDQVHHCIFEKSSIPEEYHVLIVGHGKDDIEFECFNSPYTNEEFTNLNNLINELNKIKYETR